MAKTETIRARIEPAIKHHAEAVFSQLGLSSTEAITLFYKQVILHHGLPFDVRRPRPETVAAMQQAKNKYGLTNWDSLDALKAGR